ncbi:MAG: hypothetical protein E7652_06630 [Ruminococcaceae bacterium]|nr:hypothetical protein [Oscillospiraceae bacterium]
MKNKVSKLLSVILVVLMLMPILSTSLTSINASDDVKAQLDSVIKSYPNGSRWTASFDGGIQCYGFAKLVVYKVFGASNSGGYTYRTWKYDGTPTSGMTVIGSLTDYSATNVKNLLSKAKPGDVLQFNTTKQHSMIVYQVDSDGVWIYDCNWDNNCGISLRKSSFGAWNGRNSSKLTLLRSSNYPEQCSCSSSYAGYYTCTTLSSPLNIRSGHGSSYGVVGSIPSGATVYVSKASGTSASDWGHVEYNGISGYASMEYLKKIESVTPAIRFWVSSSEYGSSLTSGTVGNRYYLCYQIIDKVSGKPLNEVVSKSYKVKISYYYPDGSVFFENTVSNTDESWISSYFKTPGTYTYAVTITGDYSYSSKKTFVINDDPIQVKVSKSSVTLTLGSKESETINVWYEGYNSNGVTLQCERNNTNVGFKWNDWVDGKAPLTVTALSKGNSTLTLRALDSTNKKVLNSIVVNVTVDAKTYTVSYNANGGTGAPSSQTKIHGTNLTLSNIKPKCTGYGFSSWNTESDGSGTYYNSGGTYSPNKGATLYAIWKANSYTIRYNANGGSGSMSDTTHYYDTAKNLSANKFTRSGYTFLGWSTSSSATSPTYFDSQSVKNLTAINGDSITLYAVWGDSSAPSAKITSTHNTATSQTVSFTFSDNNGIAGYYWGTSSNYISNTYISTSSSSASKVVTSEGSYYLTVKDKNGNVSVTYKINFSKITLNGNGASVSPSYIIAETGSGVTLPGCTRNGYTFMGWNTSSTAENGLVYITVSGNATYYGIWKSNVVPVSMQITRNPNKIDYYIGDSLDMNGAEVSVVYSDGSVKKITNSTINSGIELQNTNLKAEGEKKVTVVYGDFKDSFIVYVKSPTIELSEYELRLNKGEQHNIIVTTDPTNVIVKNDSSDKRIATIENGIIKAVGVGEAEITIRFTYNGLTYKAICKVVVEDPPKVKFPDVADNAWYSEGVYYCAGKGYITGTDKGTFNPDGKLTREQFVVILARVAGADLTQYTESPFADVVVKASTMWYAPSVIWAYENEFVNGVGDGSKFGVGQNMTREQLATMFFRYAKANGVNVEAKADLSDFADAAKVGSWAKEACEWAVEAGLIGSTSTTAKTLAPQMTVTRAQAAKIFMSYDILK